MHACEHSGRGWAGMAPAGGQGRSRMNQPTHCDRCGLPNLVGLIPDWRSSGLAICRECRDDLYELAESWGDEDGGRARIRAALAQLGQQHERGPQRAGQDHEGE